MSAVQQSALPLVVHCRENKGEFLLFTKWLIRPGRPLPRPDPHVVYAPRDRSLNLHHFPCTPQVIPFGLTCPPQFSVNDANGRHLLTLKFDDVEFNLAEVPQTAVTSSLVRLWVSKLNPILVRPTIVTGT